MKTKNIKSFWRGKKVFVTGHTGFKGSWLVLILKELGAKVTGFALDPISKPNFFDDLKLSKFLQKDYRENIQNFTKLNNAIKKAKPQLIFHLAAQSSVLVSYNNPDDTIKTNILGTFNLLKAVKINESVKSTIIVTTDKVYLNEDKKINFDENSRLGGYDIYSSSKACCEIITESFRNSFVNNYKCRVATVRSGNCIGGGDWTEDRIIKDCVDAFVKDKKLLIRSPNATRPWQHVIEPIFGYLKLAEKLYGNNGRDYIGSWNFGPTNVNLNVLNLAKLGKKIFNSKSKIIIRSKKNKKHEAKYLSLNSKKSMQRLNWKVFMKPNMSLRLTFDWFKVFYFNKKNKNEVINFTFKQIKNYQKLIKNF
jgi:CDP-glucose 4,6-dehydratase